jgi:hypothetical protein
LFDDDEKMRAKETGYLYLLLACRNDIFEKDIEAKYLTKA